MKFFRDGFKTFGIVIFASLFFSGSVNGDVIDDDFSQYYQDDELNIKMSTISGSLHSVEKSFAVVSVNNPLDNSCDHIAVDKKVTFDDKLFLLTLTITDESSTSYIGGKLMDTQLVEVFGQCNSDGSFQAEQIMIIDNLRS